MSFDVAVDVGVAEGSGYVVSGGSGLVDDFHFSEIGAVSVDEVDDGIVTGVRQFSGREVTNVDVQRCGVD